MSRNSILVAAAAALATTVALPASAEQMFNRIATFAVAENLPADADPATETSSEIIAASPDGMMLAYSDSPYGGIGLIDISDPKTPKAAGSMKLGGEPTSLVIAGQNIIVGVNTSESYTAPSGKLLVIDMGTRETVGECDLGGQPDSLALSKDGAFLAIAIENERDEDLNDGVIPQMPAGDLKIFDVADGGVDCGTMKTVDLTGIAEIAADDPEPEFVAFNDANEIAVTLQENNHVAIVSAATGEILGQFAAGSVSLEKIDTKRDGSLTFTDSQDDVRREPDAVKWLDNDRLVTANEGDYEGGSRGFTIFDKHGAVTYDSGVSFEHAAIGAGHYPDKRSNKKGIEPEGAEAAVFGDETLFFVTAERASLIGVWRDTGGEPEFLQLLASGVAPEGLVAIPSRNLLVTANEADLVEDNAARSHVMIYERSESPANYPMIVSANDDNGVPIGWGALSGLAADPSEAGKLYAVSDSFYSGQPAIFTIDATQTPAMITAKTVVTRGGMPAQKLDLEGVAADGEGGFWLASEGRTDRLTPHALFHVNAKGEIKEEVPLPAELLAVEKRFGLEGVTIVGSGDDMMLVGAIQREWADDAKGQVKLVAYKPSSKEWSAVRYPLETPAKGWMGLSEITTHGDMLYILERDNQIGAAAKVKRLYSVPMSAFQPAAQGGDLPLVSKTLVRDLLPDMQGADNGYVVDKVEGFTIDAAGEAYVVTDNDGVDDSSGETLFIRLGNISALN